jgi:predicted glycosyltransferase
MSEKSKAAANGILSLATGHGAPAANGHGPVPLAHCVPLQSARPRKWRIALYSPGMVGFGHMRRNLLVAQTLAGSPFEAVILMIAEAREASVLAMPPGGDCLTLPALCKEPDGRCQPRYLDISLQALVRLRVKAIAAALETFKPDVLIVDHLPRGALRELDSSLEDLRAYGNTRCVLGLRDVLEDPAVVRREWRKAGNEAAIRDYYDAIWVYGDPAVYDPVREYNFSRDVQAKVRYTGFLDFSRRPRYAWAERGDLLAGLPDPSQRLMLCTVGGGQDGAKLAEAFADAELPPGSVGVLLTGPFMPPEVRQRLYRRAVDNPRLRVLEFVAEPEPFLRRADRVIAMGGYNTIYEVLSFEKHALIVPRSRPRHEQQIRAQRLSDLGFLEVLSPDRVSPGALAHWLARDLGPAPRVHDRLDFNGSDRLPQLLQEVLASAAGPAPLTLPHGRFRHATR